MSSTAFPQPPLAARSTHRRILAAATEVFAQRGYADTSLQQLLDSAQIDLPTFEAHFNDTEDCFLQAYDEIVADAAARIIDSLPTSAPWPERLAAGLSTLFELIEAHPAAARLVLIEAHQAFPAAAQRYLPTIDRLARFMAQGRDLPDADPRIPPLTDSVLPAGVAFMLATRLRGRPNDPLTDLFPEAFHLLFLPYLGETGTTAALGSSPRPRPASDLDGDRR